MEHLEQVQAIIQKTDMPQSTFRRVFLFHLFRLFLSFHGTEQNKATILADIFVPLVPLVPHRGWNGTNMHGRKDQVREARELREMREFRPMEI